MAIQVLASAQAAIEEVQRLSAEFDLVASKLKDAIGRLPEPYRSLAWSETTERLVEGRVAEIAAEDTAVADHEIGGNDPENRLPTVREAVLAALRNAHPAGIKGGELIRAVEGKFRTKATTKRQMDRLVTATCWKLRDTGEVVRDPETKRYRLAETQQPPV
jgi:hypothetical protein